MNIAEKELLLKQDFDAVYEAGQSKEWSDIWKNIQTNGTRNNYNYAFCSSSFDKNNFRPKYNIIPIAAEKMFYMFNHNKTRFDFVEHLKSLNITIDFSQCTRFYGAFDAMNVSRLGVIDMSASVKANSNYGAFMNCRAIKIDKFIFSENTDFVNAFYMYSALQNITEIEGIIGKSISFSYCPLTRASIENVISHLSDTTTGLTATFKKTAKESAFTTEEWNTLIATKTNWTFSLV